jgi:hypothetical protein
MASKQDLEAAELYANVMEEIKVRAASINTLTNMRDGLPSPLVREYCFLQLRMMCELIALGCLVAHGDIEATKAKALQKAYKADEILTRLEALHPNFYPNPRKPIFGPNSCHLADYEGTDFLTKAELITLYGKTGDVLHKGSLRRLVAPKSPIQNGYPDVSMWGQKMMNLLSAHLMSRVGGDFHLVVFLSSPQVSGNVLVSVAEKSEGKINCPPKALRSSSPPRAERRVAGCRRITDDLV